MSSSFADIEKHRKQKESEEETKNRQVEAQKQEEEKAKQEMRRIAKQYDGMVQRVLTEFANAAWGENKKRFLGLDDKVWVLEGLKDGGYHWSVQTEELRSRKSRAELSAKLQSEKRGETSFAAMFAGVNAENAENLLTTKGQFHVEINGDRTVGYKFSVFVRRKVDSVSIEANLTEADLVSAIKELYKFLKSNPEPTQEWPLSNSDRIEKHGRVLVKKVGIPRSLHVVE